MSIKPTCDLNVCIQFSMLPRLARSTAIIRTAPMALAFYRDGLRAPLSPTTLHVPSCCFDVLVPAATQMVFFLDQDNVYCRLRIFQGLASSGDELEMPSQSHV